MSARPLVIRCGALGDVVLLTPILRLLHARYGEKIDVVGAGDWTRPLLEREPAVGRLQLITSRNTPYWLCPSQWALVHWLKKRGRGPVYCCDSNPAMLALVARAGIPPEDIVHRPSPDDVARAGLHLWPDRWLQMGMRDPVQPYPTREVPDPGVFRFPLLHVTDDDRRDLASWRTVNRLEGPVVLFQPGNKRTHKRGNIATSSHPKYWPPASWAAVADAIWQEQPLTKIVLCGSPAEHGVLEEIRDAAGKDARMFNAARELPVPRLLALLQQAHSLVSVDTGPAHAAAALACPLVVMFGAASPEKWRPIGPGPIHVLGGEKGEASRVRDIPVADVVAAWRRLPVRPQVDLLMP